MDKDLSILILEPDPQNCDKIQTALMQTAKAEHIFKFYDQRSLCEYLKSNDEYNINLNKQYLLLMEIDLPIETGLQTLEFIKSDPILKLIPVIVVTLHNDKDIIEKCQQAQAAICITKPADPVAFKETLKTIGHFISYIAFPTLTENIMNT